MISGLTFWLSRSACKPTHTIGFHSPFSLHGFMKADLRISIKDYHRGKGLMVLPPRLPDATEEENCSAKNQHRRGAGFGNAPIEVQVIERPDVCRDFNPEQI